MLQEEVSPGRLWVLCKAALWLWTQDLRKVLHLPGTRSLSAHKDRVKTWPHFFCPVFSEVPSIRAHRSILPIPVIPSSLVRNAESKLWAVAEGHLLPGVHSSAGPLQDRASAPPVPPLGSPWFTWCPVFS